LPSKRRLWFKIQTIRRTQRRKAGTGSATKEYELDVREAAEINSALSDQADVSNARRIAHDGATIVCQGVTPGSDGFVIDRSERSKLIAADKKSGNVIFPYLVGRELLTGSGSPSRFIIDLRERNILESQEFPAVFEHLRESVLPDREARARKESSLDGPHNAHLARWWLHWRPRSELVSALERIPRYLACSRVTKRPVFVFIDHRILPGDALQVFAFADDYSFGVLQSNLHWLWFTTKCSKLTERFRYTPESVFDTFPWAQSPSAERIDAVAEAAREVRRIREQALSAIAGGLRAVYRTLELPGANPLKDAHAALDGAVLAAYGFSATKDLLAQLLKLNLDVAARIATGQSVTSPGIPPGYSHPDRLITDDCIRATPS
jgi:hypothetical protein